MADKDPMNDIFREGLDDFHPEPSDRVWSGLEEQLNLQALNHVFHDGLADLEVAPTNDAWSGISEKITEQQFNLAFKQGLSGAEAQPSAGVWRAIEAGLRGSKRGITWWPWAISAAVISITFIGLSTWFNHHYKSPSSIKKENNIVSQKDAHTPDKSYSEPKEALENSAQRQQGTIISGSTHRDLPQRETAAWNNKAGSPVNTRVSNPEQASQNTGIKPGPEGPGFPPVQPGAMLKLTDLSEVKEESPISEIPVVDTFQHAQELTSSEQPDLTPEPSKATDQPQQETQKKQDQELSKTKRMRPAIGLTLLASPEMGYLLYNSKDQAYESLMQKSITPAVAYGFGARLDYELSKIFGIQTGVAYYQYKALFNHTTSRTEQIWVPFYDNNGQIVGQFYAGDTTIYTHTKATNRYSSINIPLQLSSRLSLGNRWQVFAAAGPYIGWVTRASGYTVNHTTGEALTIGSPGYGTERFQYGISLQTGVQFRINHFLYLRAEPSYTRQLNKLTKNSFTDRHQLSNFGLQLGLRFRLNKMYRDTDILARN